MSSYERRLEIKDFITRLRPQPNAATDTLQVRIDGRRLVKIYQRGERTLATLEDDAAAAEFDDMYRALYETIGVLDGYHFVGLLRNDQRRIVGALFASKQPP